MYRRSLSLGISVVALAVLLVPATAGAYVSIGTDPAGDDQGELRIADVVRTKRAVWRNDEGRRWLRIALWTRRALRDTNADFIIRMDSHGDARADVVMRIVMFEGKGCGVARTSGRVRITGDLASCVVPLRSVEPGGKRIRWRVISQPHEGGPAYHIDRAPDHGWYR